MKSARNLILLLLPLIMASIWINAAPDASVALVHGKVYTAVAPPIQDATILIDGGKIKAVGAGVAVPAGAEVVDLAGRVVTPGFIDIHSHIGTTGTTEDDTNENPMPIGPENLALDALHLDVSDWPEAVTGGVTTVVTGPGSGERLGGQSITIKTFGNDMQRRILREGGEVKMAVNANNLSNIPLIRSTFYKAREYMKTWEKYDAGDKKEPPPRKDLAMEALVRVLKREVRVRCHIHYASDMLTILKLKDEFGFDLTFEHSTESYKIADEIAKRNVGCVVLPLGTRIGISEDVLRGNAVLNQAGVKIAFHTDHPVSHEKWLRLNAIISIRYGLPEDAALKALTINPAELARISDRVGSIQPGKDADLVVLNGPWFEPKTRVDMVLVDGVRAYDRAKDPKSLQEDK